MGVLVVESSRDSSRTEETFVENDLKDGKKKKRRSRKSKQATSDTVSSPGNDTPSGGSVVPNGHEQLPKVFDTPLQHAVPNGHSQVPQEHIGHFGAIPPINENVQTADEHLQNQWLVPHESKEAIMASEENIRPVLVARPVECQARRKCFPPHLPEDVVAEALENGKLLTALFRVNAHNKLEAYCKIDGVQTDILISGTVAQNRAIDGDTVAIVIDPPSLWPRMKGSSETLNNSALHSYCNEAHLLLPDCSATGEDKLDLESEYVLPGNDETVPETGVYNDDGPSNESIPDNGFISEVLDDGYAHGCQLPVLDATGQYLSDVHSSMSLLEKLCALTSLNPSKRPTGRVVAVVQGSRRRDTVVGFLSVKQWIYNRENKRKNVKKNKQQLDFYNGYILLMPTNPKFTKMMVPVRSLPKGIKKRLVAGDTSIGLDLVAAKVVDWAEESFIPDAFVTQIFGRGSEIEAQLAAILFENAIDASEFSSEVLSCIPQIAWEIPQEELQSRRDLRNLCIFTIDPSTATDLDDALSIERLFDGVFRVGVHIADVSYFVSPDSALDIDAQIRSTSVYLLQGKLPMLPPILSDNSASLNPGVDRLAFSIFWDINSAGEVLDRWFGRTIIQSCCKLSYEHAQEIIGGTFDFRDPSLLSQWPKLYGQFEWPDVIWSVRSLSDLSKVLRENRFKDGALALESPKIVFLFDEEGTPYDSAVSGRRDSNFIVEEFMLLANRTAAEVITRAYPSCALLRRHPGPDARKLREFEAFCHKHGLKLDASSSVNLRRSLERLRGELKENDSVLFDILMSYATRPMQLASYFCSGDSKDTSDLGHYALAVPHYTHFTSPLRRYPDIVVHRTLAAALEAEENYLKVKRMRQNVEQVEVLSRCFTGLCFDKDEVESAEAQEALSTAASKHRVPGTEMLADVAAHCNEKKQATRNVKDSTDKLYMWVLLRKKEILFSEARVLGLGPRFMSIYIPKLTIERRIYYDDVEGLTAQWLETTSTLVLSQCANKRSSRKSSPGKFRAVEEVALVVNPADQLGDAQEAMPNHEPAFFPLTVHLMSTIPIALHAIGGDDGPLDIVARLYVSSYFHQWQG